MIDIDSLFENYFRNYIIKNSGKFTEDELENKVGEVYNEFGKTPLKELSGKSPERYFADLTDEELIDCLKDCVSRGGSVSDFLCDELSRREGVFTGLLKCIGENSGDELATYCLNVIRFDKRIRENYGVLVAALSGDDCGDSLAETITEILKDDADEVKEDILDNFGNSNKAKKYFVEILSDCSPDDRVYRLLVKNFEDNPNDYSVNAEYLGKYGDERALDVLLSTIRRSSLSYLDYKEIKLAIEELGGEIDDDAKYKNDYIYKKLH